MKKRHLLLALLIITTIFLISCSSVTNEINGANESKQTEEVDKEAIYGQALKEIAETNSTNNSGLDKRYDYLKNQVDTILAGDEALKMATFTRIKIELDYLKMKNYDSKKMSFIMSDFMKAFAAAEKVAEEADYSGYSLSDRYYSLDSDIEKVSSGKTELTVATYLQIEKGINKLNEDGYPVANKITELKGKLFKAVLAELESAIVDYEVPEIKEEIEDVVIEEPITKSVKDKEKSEVDKTIEEKVEVKPSGPQIFTVELIDGGFNMESISVNVNDTIVWENVRTGSYKIAMVLGNGQCRDVKSKLFKEGESYNTTFTEPIKCWVSDGIYTTQAMKVIVS
jgi:plastocyanin